MPAATSVDYLLVGHVSHDLTADGPRPGGTVTFASRAAQALGRRPGIITSGASDANLTELAGLPLRVTLAGETTTFENIYTKGGRRQFLRAAAARLTAESWPDDWGRPAIVHLAPIANEVDADWFTLFADSFIGLTPQGWLREWDADGRVHPTDWLEAEQLLPLATAVILSEEDLRDAAQFEQFRRWSRLLVLTQGAAGCQVYWRGESRHFPATAVTQVDPTGAGDIFAAAFFIRLQQTGSGWEAAEFANQIAALSVTTAGLGDKIGLIKQAWRK
jgi:sugar/nucleoside kinase (ribokinase family)